MSPSLLYQIKPNSIPKVEYAKNLASQSDEDAARNYASDNLSVYSIVTIAIWVAIMALGWGGCMAIQSNNPSGDNGGIYFLLFILTVAFASIATKLICSAVRDNFFESKLQEVATNRLNAEHEEEIRPEIKTTASAASRAKECRRERYSSEGTATPGRSQLTAIV